MCECDYEKNKTKTGDIRERKKRSGDSRNLKNLLQSTTQDLFELLERVQSSRLDDQRCVLPSYFSQVCVIRFRY